MRRTRRKPGQTATFASVIGGFKPHSSSTGLYWSLSLSSVSYLVASSADRGMWTWCTGAEEFAEDQESAG